MWWKGIQIAGIDLVFCSPRATPVDSPARRSTPAEQPLSQGSTRLGALAATHFRSGVTSRRSTSSRLMAELNGTSARVWSMYTSAAAPIQLDKMSGPTLRQGMPSQSRNRPAPETLGTGMWHQEWQKAWQQARQAWQAWPKRGKRGERGIQNGSRRRGRGGSRPVAPPTPLLDSLLVWQEAQALYCTEGCHRLAASRGFHAVRHRGAYRTALKAKQSVTLRGDQQERAPLQSGMRSPTWWCTQAGCSPQPPRRPRQPAIHTCTGLHPRTRTSP